MPLTVPLTPQAYNDAYVYAAKLLPLLILSPQFFRGEIDYGVVLQVIQVNLILR
jgi:ABC-type uncharacterized transport system fused permease/ATPase subunit